NNLTFFIELVDASGNPVRRGVPGELLVTSIGDRLCPHVRYRTGDVYTWLPDCCCGHAFPAVRHEGRRRHFIVGADGALTPKEVDDMIDFEWLAIYKLDQVSPRAALLTYVATREPPGASHLIEERLGPRLGAIGVDLKVRSHEAYVSAERSGKFSSCVS